MKILGTPARRSRLGLAALILPLLLPRPGAAQGVDFDQVQVIHQEVRGGVHLLGNAGGNIAVFLGEDGVFMVDAGYEQMVEKVLEMVGALAEETGANPTLRFLANTHWHYDHTTGNEGIAGAGATIIAHEGAARLMAEDRVLAALGQDVPATPPGGRPTVTFNDRINFGWNGDLLHLVHMPLAHSDGDVVVHFRDADVVHMGDLFFNGTYPYIDVDYGGNLQGMVRGVREVVDHTNETTLFIPGHGPLGTHSDLVAYLEMLETSLERVRELVDRGLSREEAIDAKPMADLDPIWAPEGSFIFPAFWVGLVYDGMVRAAPGG